MTEHILSASQIATFGTTDFGGTTEGCQRKWAKKYIEHKPDKGSDSAQIGKRIHTLLEQWLRAGEMPKGTDLESKIARAMIKKLPSPPQTRVEEPFVLEVEGVKYRGIKDLVYKDDNTLVIHDHKTTSGLQWAKDAEALRHDVQSIIYARHGFTEADLVRLSWLYGTRERSPQVQPVILPITFKEVNDAMPPITTAGKRILQLYKDKPEPDDLPPNLSVCQALGVCPYWDTCKLTTAERLIAIMRQHNKKEETIMGFRDRKQQVQVEVKEVIVEDAPAKVSMREKLGFGASITPPPPPEKEVIDTVGTPVSDESKAFIEAETKSRRGRPKGSKNKVVKEDEAIMSPPADSPAADSPPYTKHSNFTLLVGCIPYGNEMGFLRFSEWVRPILDAINTSQDVGHYKQIDFGKGVGLYASALWSYLEQNPFVGILVVDPNTDEGRDALPTLERFADVIIRRF